MYPIVIKRIYEEASATDGYRILVDRIWPRGISKDVAKLDDWNKNIAPTSRLRKWFDHKEERFLEFEQKYREELKLQFSDLDKILEIAKNQKVTLLYGAKNVQMNQAVVIQKVFTENF